MIFTEENIAPLRKKENPIMENIFKKFIKEKNNKTLLEKIYSNISYFSSDSENEEGKTNPILNIVKENIANLATKLEECISIDTLPYENFYDLHLQELRRNFQEYYSNLTESKQQTIKLYFKNEKTKISIENFIKGLFYSELIDLAFIKKMLEIAATSEAVGKEMIRSFRKGDELPEEEGKIVIPYIQKDICLKVKKLFADNIPPLDSGYTTMVDVITESISDKVDVIGNNIYDVDGIDGGDL